MSTTQTLQLSNGLSAEGTSYWAPLPDGRSLEVFRDVDTDLYRHLTEGRIGPYLRAAPRTFRRWSAAQPADGRPIRNREASVAEP